MNVHQPNDPSWDFRRFITLLKSRGVLVSNFWNTVEPTIRIACIGHVHEADIRFALVQIEATLAEMGVGVHVLGHPLVRFTRDKAGKVSAVGEGKHESLMLLEIDRLPPEEMAQVEKRIRTVLDEVRAIVRDWSSMREKMLALADDMATRRMPVDDDGRARHRSSFAGPPPTTSPSSATANTASRRAPASSPPSRTAASACCARATPPRRATSRRWRRTTCRRAARSMR